MAERVDVVEEECDSWFCWCRDDDGWLLTRLSASATPMRWSPGYVAPVVEAAIALVEDYQKFGLMFEVPLLEALVKAVKGLDGRGDDGGDT